MSLSMSVWGKNSNKIDMFFLFQMDVGKAFTYLTDRSKKIQLTADKLQRNISGGEYKWW